MESGLCNSARALEIMPKSLDKFFNMHDAVLITKVFVHSAATKLSDSISGAATTVSRPTGTAFSEQPCYW